MDMGMVIDMVIIKLYNLYVYHYKFFILFVLKNINIYILRYYILINVNYFFLFIVKGFNFLKKLIKNK